MSQHNQQSWLILDWEGLTVSYPLRSLSMTQSLIPQVFFSVSKNPESFKSSFVVVIVCVCVFPEVSVLQL